LTVTTILHTVKSDGINLALTTASTIKVSGRRETVARWLPQLRVHKAAIIEALTVGADTTAAPFDDELFQERAAIMEFDGGLSRAEAERRAYLEVTNHG
jgi:hypothetical protein